MPRLNFENITVLSISCVVVAVNFWAPETLYIIMYKFSLILACSILMIFHACILYYFDLKFLLQILAYLIYIVYNFQHQIMFLASVLIFANVLVYIVKKLKTATQFIL